MKQVTECTADKNDSDHLGSPFFTNALQQEVKEVKAWPMSILTIDLRPKSIVKAYQKSNCPMQLGRYKQHQNQNSDQNPRIAGKLQIFMIHSLSYNL